MTFEDKRKDLLGNFDKCAATLRDFLADPSLVNDDYPPYVRAGNEFEWAKRHLLHLNQAERL